MTMNFFEHQDKARQNTKQLIGLFGAAVLCIILTIYLLAVVVFGGNPSSGSKAARRSGSYSRQYDGSPQPPMVQSRRLQLWNPQLLGMVALPTLLLIGGGSLYKIQRLRAGGAVIAQEMGGKLVTPDTTNPDEQRLLNVVEEMAIAAGISVPAVYVLEQERGINAFAAGFTPNDAVIGVTRGCLEVLSRDELQGVIGHEFSHILNGDMRLNLNLIGVLNGLLLIYISGRVLADLQGSVRDRDGKAVPIALFGLGLIVIGLIGVFFGRLIKAAVSRQREFLADASAVQFTRNPQGIAGALRKISQHSHQALVDSPYAEENSHMFFGSALRFAFLGEMFATHPSLGQRIRRIEGGARLFEEAPVATGTAIAADESGVMGLAGNLGGASEPSATPAAMLTTQRAVAPAGVVAQVGTVNPEHYAYAKALVAQLPEALQGALRSQQGAIAVVYSLFLDEPESAVRQKQLEWLQQVEVAERLDQVTQLSELVDGLDPACRLPLLDLTIPALRQCSAKECQHLFKVVQGLVRADGRWSLNEFTLQVVLWHRLQPCVKTDLTVPVKFATLEAVWTECMLLVSVLAQVGETRPEAIAYAFRTGAFRLPGANPQVVPAQPLACTVADLQKSLEKLRFAAPKVKQGLVDACAHTVLLDSVVNVQEADLLRAIAITLDSPLPPFLSVQQGGATGRAKSGRKAV